MENNSSEFPIDADSILNRLSVARKLPTGWGRDSALGREFGISSKRVSAWRERNTLDHLLIIHKCREWELNINWVYYGDGGPDVVPRVNTDEVLLKLAEHLNTLFPPPTAENQPGTEASEGAAAEKTG